ncbi:MAG: hypothetical protein KGK07_15210 [Chloroflexota bacterium]|nr:hypothetical protein [Chloroflexota bacterium]
MANDVRFEQVRAAVALAALSVPSEALDGIRAAIESDERMVARALAAQVPTPQRRSDDWNPAGGL